MVTHEEEIAQHCRRVVEMRDGKIFSDNDSEEKLIRVFDVFLSDRKFAFSVGSHIR